MRSHRVLLNFLFSFIRAIIGTVLSLATTPLILSAIGDERFGAFRILLDWLTHIGTLEFGLYSASLALLAKSTTEGARQTLQSLRLIIKNYLLVFVLQVVAFVIFSILIEKLIPVSESLQHELHLSSLIMSLSLLFLMSQVFKAYLESTQKGYLVSVILVVFNITYLLMATIAAVQGYGLPGQVGSYVASLLISFLILIFFAPEVLKAFTFQKQPADANAHLLNKQRLSHFINELCARISLMSDNIIVAAFMGAQTVTAFFITQKVGSLMQQQLQHLSNSSWAALSEIYYQKKLDLFRSRVITLTETIAYFSGSLLSVVCLLNPSFISLWTGEHTFAGLAVSNLTAVNAALFSILSLWSWCFAATNNTDKIVTMSIVQGMVNLAASCILTFQFGIAGPLWGTLIGYACVSMGWKSWVLCKTFQMSFSQLTLAWAKPLIPPLAITGGLLYFIGGWRLTSWFQLTIAGFGITTLFMSLNYFFLLSANTKNLVQEKIRAFYFKLKNKKG